MGADSLELAIRAMAWQERSLTRKQAELLGGFADWLVSEAAGAGGIGPNEKQRIWSRHIADSLLFGRALNDHATCLDIGSGAGLPGIPLAITRPETSFVLLDRSGRRCDLMRRATGILELPNCRVIQQDVAEVDERFGAIVSRAAIPPEMMMIHVKRILKPGGVAILGLSHTAKPQQTLTAPVGLTSSVISVPADILDTEINLLRIEAT